jgi:copper(I)-binding protein
MASHPRRKACFQRLCPAQALTPVLLRLLFFPRRARTPPFAVRLNRIICFSLLKICEINMKNFVYATLCAGLMCAPLSTSAQAHISFENATAKIGGAWKAIVRVPHGCDGAATQSISITLPDGVFNAKPQPKAGLHLTTQLAPYDKVYWDHGEKITAGAKTLTWSGGSIGDDQYDEFVFVASISPDLQPNQKLVFPTVQSCTKGQINWSALPDEKSATPAPTLTLIASSSLPESKIGALVLQQGWSRATPNGAPVAGGYLRITNNGSSTDRLLGGTTPAGTAIQVHEMTMKDGVMMMREIVGGLEIAAGSSVELKPGGNHLMIIGLKQNLREGDHLPITLMFEKAGKVDFDLSVRAMNAQNAGSDQHSEHMEHMDHMDHMDHMQHMDHMH